MEILLISFLSLTLFSCLFFAPLKFSDGYIFPQIFLTALGISVCTVLFISNGTFIFNTITGLVFFYFVYLLFTNSFSTVPHNSLPDLPLIFASLFGFLISQVLFKDINNIVIISLTVFCLSQVVSIYALLQKRGIDPLFPQRIKPIQGIKERIEKGDKVEKSFINDDFIDKRAISFFGNTNFAGGYFVCTLPFLIFLSIEVNVYFLFSFVLVFAAIWATRSRAAMLGVLVSGLSFLVFLSSKGIIFDSLFYLFEDLRLEVITLFLIIVFFGGWYLLNIAKDKKWLSELSESNKVNDLLDIEDSGPDHWTSHLRYRFRYWKAGWHLIKQKPLQGWGIRTYRAHVYDAQRDLNHKTNGKFLGDAYVTPQPRECHNDILENFVESGLLGGFTFLFIIGLIFYNSYNYLQGINNINEFILIAGITAGIIAILVDCFFFFVLRLGPSSLLFWLSLSMLESISSNEILYVFNVNILFVILITLALIIMLWEGSIKPNLGNFYFSLSQFSHYPENKEKYLTKAIKTCPKDNMYRTHAMIGYLDSNPYESEGHAETIRQHFDGMVPAWAARTNFGIIKAKRKDYETAISFFNDAINYYPKFQQAQQLYAKMFPKAPFPKRRIMNKEFTEEAKSLISNYHEKLNSTQMDFQSKINEINSIICNIILSEKVKNRIPEDWVCDIKNGSFIPLSEISDPANVIKFGPTNVLILK